MTRLGKFLDKKAVKKALISRRSGLSKQRLSELTTNSSSRLTANELYLIALSIEEDPAEMLRFLCGHLKVELKPGS